MDLAAICNNYSLKDGQTFEKILPNSSTAPCMPKPSLLQEGPDVKSDALLAVKLDPAVLEARMTIDSSENFSIHGSTTNSLSNNKPYKEAEHLEKFEKAMHLQRAALFSLSSEQFTLLMKYVDVLRQQRLSQQKYLECGFCKRNGQPEAWYTTHALKDGRGRVRCPALRALACRRCGATGDHAHTVRYCPQI